MFHFKESMPEQDAPKASPEDRWLEIVQQIAAVLTSDGNQIPTDMVPFDATSEVPIDEQKYVKITLIYMIFNICTLVSTVKFSLQRLFFIC